MGSEATGKGKRTQDSSVRHIPSCTCFFKLLQLIARSKAGQKRNIARLFPFKSLRIIRFTGERQKVGGNRRFPCSACFGFAYGG